ncbi:MAG: DUF4197 domain-containing protein [Chitinophagales bacterium]
MKKIILPFLFAGSLIMSSCDTLQSVAQTAAEVLTESSGSSTYTPSSLDMSNGLKSALNVGITNGADRLSQTNGYFGNALLKIVMPPEAQQVEKTLRDIGAGKLVDDAILSFNRGAEKAAKEAAPIFINSIKQMSFNDAKEILLSNNKTSATAFLKRTSYTSLEGVFTPVINNSLKSVNATKYWGDVINTYNQIPLVKKVNPDLTAYVTEQALNGLFKMVEKEEIKIRENLSARTTDILQKVFGWADKQ